MRKNIVYVIKEAISHSFFRFAFFKTKEQLAKVLHDSKFLSLFYDKWGTWKDEQIPNTYSHYSDVAMETLLTRTLPTMQRITNLDLIPCYTYARIYKYGDELHRHKDRPSCEISATLNLGGDSWPIMLDPTGQEGEKGVILI